MKIISLKNWGLSDSRAKVALLGLVLFALAYLVKTFSFRASFISDYIQLGFSVNNFLDIEPNSYNQAILSGGLSSLLVVIDSYLSSSVSAGQSLVGFVYKLPGLISYLVFAYCVLFKEVKLKKHLACFLVFMPFILFDTAIYCQYLSVSLLLAYLGVKNIEKNKAYSAFSFAVLIWFFPTLIIFLPFFIYAVHIIRSNKFFTKNNIKYLSIFLAWSFVLHLSSYIFLPESVPIPFEFLYKFKGSYFYSNIFFAVDFDHSSFNLFFILLVLVPISIVSICFKSKWSFIDRATKAIILIFILSLYLPYGSNHILSLILILVFTYSTRHPNKELRWLMFFFLVSWLLQDTIMFEIDYYIRSGVYTRGLIYGISQTFILGTLLQIASIILFYYDSIKCQKERSQCKVISKSNLILGLINIFKNEKKFHTGLLACLFIFVFLIFFGLGEKNQFSSKLKTSGVYTYNFSAGTVLSKIKLFDERTIDKLHIGCESLNLKNITIDGGVKTSMENGFVEVGLMDNCQGKVIIYYQKNLLDSLAEIQFFTASGRLAQPITVCHSTIGCFEPGAHELLDEQNVASRAKASQQYSRFDEGFYNGTANWRLVREHYLHSHPHGYRLIIHYLKTVLGDSKLTSRLPAACASILVFITLFILLKKLKLSRSEIFFSMFLFSIDPLSIAVGRSAIIVTVPALINILIVTFSVYWLNSLRFHKISFYPLAIILLFSLGASIKWNVMFLAPFLAYLFIYHFTKLKLKFENTIYIFIVCILSILSPLVLNYVSFREFAGIINIPSDFTHYMNIQYFMKEFHSSFNGVAAASSRFSTWFFGELGVYNGGLTTKNRQLLIINPLYSVTILISLFLIFIKSKNLLQSFAIRILLIFTMSFLLPWIIVPRNTFMYYWYDIQIYALPLSVLYIARSKKIFFNYKIFRIPFYICFVVVSIYSIGIANGYLFSTKVIGQYIPFKSQQHLWK